MIWIRAATRRPRAHGSCTALHCNVMCNVYCNVSTGCLRIYSFCLFPAPIKAGNYKPGQQQID